MQKQTPEQLDDMRDACLLELNNFFRTCYDSAEPYRKDDMLMIDVSANGIIDQSLVIDVRIKTIKPKTSHRRHYLPAFLGLFAGLHLLRRAITKN